MRTSINIPEDLLKEAMKACEAPTQTIAVIMGLQALIQKKQLKELSRYRNSNTLKSKASLKDSRRR
mgnify:CR=1